MIFRAFVVHVRFSLLSEVPPRCAIALLSTHPAAQSNIDDDEM
jgi:hypothetical protein